MKGLFLFLAITGCFLSGTQAQKGVPSSMRPMVDDMNRNMILDKNHTLMDSVYSMIDGVKIAGTPFMNDWQLGTVTTAAGKTFSQYLLKYNAYSQTLFCLSGIDSIEVSEELNEFNIVRLNENGDTLAISRYVNGRLVHDGHKNVAYYEILSEDARGQLLKLSKKVVLDLKKSEWVRGRAMKYFTTETTYYYYNKQEGRITTIKPNGGNLRSVLGLDKETAQNIGMDNYDFREENELVQLVKAASAVTAKKAF